MDTTKTSADVLVTDKDITSLKPNEDENNPKTEEQTSIENKSSEGAAKELSEVSKVATNLPAESNELKEEKPLSAAEKGSKSILQTVEPSNETASKVIDNKPTQPLKAADLNENREKRLNDALKGTKKPDLSPVQAAQNLEQDMYPSEKNE